MTQALPLSSTVLKRLANQLQDPRWRSDQLFMWLVEDVLADLTGTRKTNPPPAQALLKIQALASAYATAVATAPPFEDLLGALFMSVVCSSDQRYHGQFFTPMPVARLMVEMVVSKESAAPPPDRLWRVCEPACGSGVLLLALCERQWHRHGVDALRSWSFTAMDRDPLCAGITAAQLLVNQWIHQVPLGELVVYAGDTLGLVDDWQVVVHQVTQPLPPCSVLPALHPSRTEAVKAAAQQSLDTAGQPVPITA